MIVCARLPRFELLAALEGRRELLRRPVALAPEPGSAQLIGAVSGAAEAFGLYPGMRLGEALGRCPGLLLVQPDPARAERSWEKVLRRLESVGAAVEPGRLGEAFFEADGLRSLWGEVHTVIGKARRAIDAPARFGAAPSRFCAYVAAGEARPRRAPLIVRNAAAFLHPKPVGLLREWVGRGPGSPVDVLERFGIGTLGELAELAPAALADRFGSEGLAARELARGGGPALRPRPAAERIAEWIELPEAASGPQLERALELLVRRLLAGSARRGRSFRRVRLSARLAAGGSWSSTVTLRRASASHDRLRLALGPRLEQLPGPAAKLGIEALVLGPPPQDQLSLVEARSGRAGHESHQRRLAEAVRQVRAAAGRDAVLRVLDLDPGSRIPERRAMLAPF